MHHLTLTTTFFNAAPKNPIFASPETAQLFVFTLGAVHALSNPLDFWQSFKSAFAFLGNRKGRLTPQLNQHIFGTITALCAPAVAESVKDYVLQRSKQVKAGIRAVGGKRRYEGFGQSELAAFANTAFNCIDLTECCTGSLALGGGAAQQFVQTYCMDRDNRSKWVMDANKLLREMVNPVDEDA